MLGAVGINPCQGDALIERTKYQTHERTRKEDRDANIFMGDYLPIMCILLSHEGVLA